MEKRKYFCSARIVVALLAAIAGVGGASARAQDLPVVTVNVFPGGFNWPSYVARDKGFFAHNGIEVALQFTPNSVAQMTGLAEGKFDIAITAVDNIVAYVEGQGRRRSARSRNSLPSWAATAAS